ncbi:MAG: YdcF family protein [Clostridia bacterium]|nr:YdcF family protein [Clostridia bacterium]
MRKLIAWARDTGATVWQWLVRLGRRMPWKWILRVACLVVCLGILLSSICLAISGAVCHKTQARVVTPQELALMEGEFDYILVLGCLVYSDGTLSHMLEDRVKVGVSLYQAGVCDTILMSGDHQSDDYNEVDPMKAAAEAQGVPEQAILTDPLGLSTYDSIRRVLSEFAGKRIVIVTQEYHLYRALYIAEKLGIEAYGVSADLRPYRNQWTRDLRELLARCKDVYFALKQP